MINQPYCIKARPVAPKVLKIFMLSSSLTAKITHVAFLRVHFPFRSRSRSGSSALSPSPSPSLSSSSFLSSSPSSFPCPCPFPCPFPRRFRLGPWSLVLVLILVLDNVPVFQLCLAGSNGTSELALAVETAEERLV
jgi:hypothetical protein